MNKLDLQAFLFEEQTKRIDLLNFVSTIAPSYRISVVRNHSFELIENTIKPYLDFGGLGVEFSYSSYDDSLSFLELELSSDTVILWLDLSDYETHDLKQFVRERIDYLRSIFNGTILFVPCGKDVDFDADKLGVTVYDLSNLKQRLGDKFFDIRLEAFSGTKLSSDANLAIARDLGLNFIPALLRPSLKGVIVDLDNTLYHGVLGEDGVNGVLLSDAHYQLQSKLKSLSEQGFFLSIASKNDERDVIELFEKRTDFPLKLDDFVQVYANWENKADSISAIAKSLNIAADSLLFIDDNIGEIISAQEVHHAINVIWAKDDAAITHNVLSNYPGLLKLDFQKEDRLRKKDTRANQQRLEMQTSTSHKNYLQDLNMQLVFEVDNPKHIARVSELSNKTNQFIFSYKRYSPQQVESLMSGNTSAVVTVSLSDRLSESGIIGVVVITRQSEPDSQKDWGLLDECFVSCRALGRGIDDVIVLGGIRVALDHLSIKNGLQIEFTKGQRNAPAEKFAMQYLGAHMASPMNIDYRFPTDYVSVTIR